MSVEPSENPLFSPAAPPRPAVWAWYVAYCLVMGAGLLVLAVLGLAVAVFAAPEELSALERPLLAAFFTGICLPLAGFYGIAPFLPRRPWSWAYGLGAIALGFANTFTLPAAIALLVFWLKPRTRNFFQTP